MLEWILLALVTLAMSSKEYGPSKANYGRGRKVVNSLYVTLLNRAKLMSGCLK